MMLRDIGDLLPFLSFLREMGINGVPYHLRYDAVTVRFTLPNAKVEVDFFDDHVEYSVFEGGASTIEKVKSLILE